MQELARSAAQDFARGLSIGLIVLAGRQRCLDCTCTCGACPDCICQDGARIIQSSWAPGAVASGIIGLLVGTVFGSLTIYYYFVVAPLRKRLGRIVG